MAKTLQFVGDWRARQLVRLREWRRKCLPATLVVVILAFLGIALIALVPLPGSLTIGIGTLVALVPLMLTMHWLIPISQIWDIHPSWVAMATFLISAILALFGRYFAGQLLSDLFHEPPAMFPIAQTISTYFGAVLGAIATISSLALVALLASAGWVLLSGLLGRTGLKRFLRDITIYLVLATLIGWTIGSLAVLEKFARDASRWIAIEADFHTSNRCQNLWWPAGVSRVAFVGDEQVLGYQPKDDKVVVLACRRAGVLGEFPH